MEKCFSLSFQNNLPGGLLLLILVFIAILLIKINNNIKDLKEYFSLGVTSHHHDKKN